MPISLFELFSIGIGPSSSHTVGPMQAALEFISSLKPQLKNISQVQVKLYGSLALTGIGHGTDVAILNGLSGYSPEDVTPSEMRPLMDNVKKNKQLALLNTHLIQFDIETDLIFLQKEWLERHSNAMTFFAYDNTSQLIHSETFYSIGGGFIATDLSIDQPSENTVKLPFPFSNCEELMSHCNGNKMTIAEVMLQNELSWRNEHEIKEGILTIAKVMEQCIYNGCHSSGILPGGLNVKRRAPELYNKLKKKQGIASIYEDADIMNRLNLYAISVNEENAAGGRIVTAPTNGASGIIPSVLHYIKDAHQHNNDESVMTYFLTAGAIAILYKKGASISGAEVGCQGEVGVASSMAAAGLTAVLKGNNAQVENAAEIAMEHHLGMTCDPVAGLVQIPCIERNAMGAVKAVNAARMALIGDGQHKIPLDKVIKTMKQTGHDMQTIYKETSQGGLAVNFPEC